MLQIEILLSLSRSDNMLIGHNTLDRLSWARNFIVSPSSNATLSFFFVRITQFFTCCRPATPSACST